MGLFVVLTIVACATALPESLWKETNRAPASARLRFSLALFHPEGAAKALEDAVLEVSNPSSSSYGQWLSIEEVTSIVSPARGVRTKVKNVLDEEGVRVLKDNGDHLVVSATAEVVERLFDTQVAEFRKEGHPDVLFRAKGYTIPKKLSSNVQFAAGLTELPRNLMKPKVYKTNPGSEQIIPEFLRLLYNISTSETSAGTNSSFGVAEFQDDNSYLKSDLEHFYKEMAEPSFGKIEDVGPFSTQGGPDAESSLDIQYGGAIARGSKDIFWVETTWMLDFAQKLAVRKDAPLVVSMSWGWPEDGQCDNLGNCGNGDAKSYVDRTNVEFSKIVARGITLVASSGDQGAPGDNFPGCGNGMSDLFPASSPWVTAVGATMLGTKPGNKKRSSPVTAPVCHKRGISCARGDITHEEVCSFPTALITSGGMFSSYTEMPSWQSAHVSDYLTKAAGKLPPSHMFDSKHRAFPDVSANGHAYLVMLQGSPQAVDGTSCSAPVFGGMIALINGMRMKKGKSSLGFINQALYAAPKNIFTDIVGGNNKATEGCVSQYGFEALEGWDAATGLGTPQFNLFAAHFVDELP